MTTGPGDLRAAVLARRHRLLAERVDLKVAAIGVTHGCATYARTGECCPSCRAVKDQLDQRAMAIAGTIYLN